MLTTLPLDSTYPVLSSIKTEYTAKYLQYPLIDPIRVNNSVYLTEQQFTFWDDVSVYLPSGSVLEKAYVSPDDHAFNGLSKLKELNSSYDFDSIVAKRTRKSASSSSSSIGVGFFSGSQTSDSSTTSSSSIVKTHPGLNGKFGEYYLHQFDYDNVKSELAALGYSWDLPYEDDYQKGLLMRIDISSTTVDKSLLQSLISGICASNSYLNVKSVSLSGSYLIVKFKSSKIPTLLSEFAIVNTGPQNNISDCFTENTTNKIYSHLKDNGYGNLDEAVSPAALRGLPASERRKGSALAKAIKDSLIDVLGGPEGVISQLQGSTNEYLIGIINGLVAANQVICNELDRLGGGTTKKKVFDAFESGMNSAVLSKNVSSMLKNGMEISKSSAKGLLAAEQSTIVAENAKSISSELQTARDQTMKYSSEFSG